MAFKVITLALTLGLLSQNIHLTAAELKTRLVAREIQSAEELIAIAARAGDFSELKRQAGALSDMSARIPETEEMGTRMACASSAGTLRNVADSLSRPDQAKSVVAARRDIDLYRETMPMCEADVGLQPPIGMSLRGP